MPEQTDSKPVRLSCRLFDRLLILYPKAHRREYGAAMLQLFRDQCRDAWAARRFLGLITLWLRVLPDLLKTSLMEHLTNLNQITFMLKSFRPSFRPYSIFFRVFGAVIVLAVLISVLISLMLPEMYRSTARILVESVLGPSPTGRNVFQAEAAIFQSAAVRERVIEQLNLRELWGQKYGDGNPLTKSEADALLANRLVFQPVRNTDVVEISAFADTPDEAAKLANGAASAYREIHKEKILKSGEPLPLPRALAVTILDPAVSEPRAVRPNKQLNTVLGGMMGALLGLLVGTVAAGAISAIRRNRLSASCQPAA